VVAIGLFSFLSSKPAVKLTTNLYLGDKNHVPEDAEFVVVCAIELMKEYVKLHKKKNIKMENIIFDLAKPRVFLKLIDWARFDQVDLQTSIDALKIIDQKIAEGKKVYVHCMYGVNRSASHCFMYLVGKGIIKEDSFKKGLREFKKIYPGINPLFGWKKLLKYYYPFHDFFDENAEVLSKKIAIAKYKKEQWLKKVRLKATKKENKARAKSIYKQ
jgi:protein-tyrosine phosphatase